MRLPSNLSAEVTLDGVAAKREVLEVLRDRADLLPARDRALVMLYLEYGTNFNQIAQLTGLCRSQVARRIRATIARLRDDTYLSCVRHGGFSRLELVIIREHFMQGLSLRRIAHKHHLCYYRARKAVRKARRAAARAPVACAAGDAN